MEQLQKSSTGVKEGTEQVLDLCLRLFEEFPRQHPLLVAHLQQRPEWSTSFLYLLFSFSKFCHFVLLYWCPYTGFPSVRLHRNQVRYYHFFIKTFFVGFLPGVCWAFKFRSISLDRNLCIKTWVFSVRDWVRSCSGRTETRFWRHN